jgi:hypothetical protein
VHTEERKNGIWNLIKENNFCVLIGVSSFLGCWRWPPYGGGQTWIPKQWDADYSKFYHQSYLSATEITVTSLKLFHKIQAGENAF